MRADYVPAEYALALRQLQDDAEPFGSAPARTVVEAELGRPLDELFTDFEPDPFAAASLAQVHRATLPDGRRVAVKIQRPGAETQMREDLELLAFLARRLERRAPEVLGFRPTAMVAELSDTTRRELDFRQEARTCRRVGEYFAGRDDVVIPWVDADHSTARVLTMQLIEGFSPAPAAALRERGLDVDRLLDSGARAMLDQLFTLGLFHADPHPGNLLFLPGDRVAFLDFGMFGRPNARHRRRLALMMWALVQGDFDAVAGQLLGFTTPGPQADHDSFREALHDVVEDWYGGKEKVSIAHLLVRQLGLGAQFGIVFPRDLLLVARALVGLEATTSLVVPERSFRELLEPLVADVRDAVLPNRAQLKEALERRRLEYLELALDLPDLLPDLARRWGNGSPSPHDLQPSPRTARQSPAWLLLAATTGVAAGCLAAGRALRHGAAGSP
ncbi:AarF/ABC1/UbiB kinase family protein [Pseudonocardia sp. KRD-182]|uniref:ABC1 kinase family protein n=1 Tax=Pseudonocardia oceani TaxID=2792013 RepID=UPI001C4A3E66|nr:AarF/ABC1/UbiB kinase family protein [Pseudonocardia oceani]MBW0111831.1 AarF/ABC1/UbiB kinase family protein [Pseudonocardia oceani]